MFRKLCSVVLGHEAGDISEEIAHFSDEVSVVDNPLLSAFQVDLYAHAFEQLCRSRDPEVVLMGHTLDNLDLAPRLGCNLGVQLITDCIGLDIEPERGQLLCTKPIYGDNAIATFIKKLRQLPWRKSRSPSVSSRFQIQGDPLLPLAFFHWHCSK